MFPIEQLTIKVVDKSTNGCILNTRAISLSVERIAKGAGFKVIDEATTPDVERDGIHATMVLGYNGYSLALSSESSDFFCVLNSSVRVYVSSEVRVSYSNGHEIVGAERMAGTQLYVAGEEFLSTGPKPLDEIAIEGTRSLVEYVISEIHAARRGMLDRYPNDFEGFRGTSQP